MASKACCKIPPVVIEGYTPKGTYSDLGGLNTYVTGDKDAKTAVIAVFDIFGFTPQIIQGADIIAAGGNHLVIMPNFFRGPGIDPTLFPVDTPEKTAKVTEFIQGPANVEQAVKNLQMIMEKATITYPGVERWAVIGYCWGGKAATLISGPSTPFKISISLHPGFLKSEDATHITIPHLLLASRGESADEVSKIAVILKNHVNEVVRTKSHVETYDAVHGWMAARANLGDEDALRVYKKGYEQVVDYLTDHLTAAL
ncbi:hypothetical protein Q9L58_009867 [Maublancomyces gigas]|uniref:Dienelactone hydrolase domain-containing protein n=1 Tax=Discina gigas TaxID=1032678 RepID=A0ABR3G617_9PEZI